MRPPTPHRALQCARRTRDLRQATVGVQVKKKTAACLFSLVPASSRVGRSRGVSRTTLSCAPSHLVARCKKSVCSSHTAVGSSTRHTSPALRSSHRALPQGASPYGSGSSPTQGRYLPLARANYADAWLGLVPFGGRSPYTRSLKLGLAERH